MAWYFLGSFSWLSDGHPYPFLPRGTPLSPGFGEVNLRRLNALSKKQREGSANALRYVVESTL